MELRTTEETVQKLLGQYESLRQASTVWSSSSSSSAAALPVYTPLPTTTTAVAAAGDGSTTTTTTNILTPIPNVAMAADVLQNLQTRLYSSETTIPGTMERFRKRLEERDPITDKPRYGELTQQRVRAVVHAYDFLQRHIPSGEECHDDDDDNNDNNITPAALASRNVLRQLQHQHTHHRTRAEIAHEEDQRRRQQDEETARDTLRRQREEETQREALAAQERIRAEAAAADELRRRAAAARQRRSEEQRAEREWAAALRAGGIRAPLQRLHESCLVHQLHNGEEEGEAEEDGASAYATAITSLHRLFQQIYQHPEDANFRRIRRDNAQFVQDIGRHKGGVEVLVAAGFELGAVDDIPCYLSKEPNLETDMDGWMAWFDRNKEALEILQQELLQLAPTKKNKRRPE